MEAKVGLEKMGPEHLGYWRSCKEPWDNIRILYYFFPVLMRLTYDMVLV